MNILLFICIKTTFKQILRKLKYIKYRIFVLVFFLAVAEPKHKINKLYFKSTSTKINNITNIYGFHNHIHK